MIVGCIRFNITHITDSARLDLPHAVAADAVPAVAVLVLHGRGRVRRSVVAARIGPRGETLHATAIGVALVILANISWALKMKKYYYCCYCYCNRTRNQTTNLATWIVWIIDIRARARCCAFTSTANRISSYV